MDGQISEITTISDALYIAYGKVNWSDELHSNHRRFCMESFLVLGGDKELFCGPVYILTFTMLTKHH